VLGSVENVIMPSEEGMRTALLS
jgi:hypothetical protein